MYIFRNGDVPASTWNKSPFILMVVVSAMSPRLALAKYDLLHLACIFGDLMVTVGDAEDVELNVDATPVA